MKSENYKLCYNVVNEILGGKIQFTISALKAIVYKDETMLDDEFILNYLEEQTAQKYIENLRVLEYSNDRLKMIDEQLLYESHDDFDFTDNVSYSDCKHIAYEIDTFLDNYERCVESLKEINEKFRTDIADVEGGLEFQFELNTALRRVSEDYNEGLIDKVEEANIALKKHIEKFNKISKR